MKSCSLGLTAFHDGINKQAKTARENVQAPVSKTVSQLWVSQAKDGKVPAGCSAEGLAVSV